MAYDAERRIRCLQHACGALPPPVISAPAWLRADRARPEAAFALYKGRYADAVYRLRAIGGRRNDFFNDRY